MTVVSPALPFLELTHMLNILFNLTKATSVKPEQENLRPSQL
jgi:hypothetical protein